jgi:GntR family transcriptional regulator/MocR family aminotransferase
MSNPAPQSWANSGRDLLVDIDRGGGRGLRAGLEESLREAIRSGRLGAGTRLPPSRALARDLGISRGTVVHAYGQLVAEGWLAGRRGSGTVVARTAESGSSVAERREPMPTRWRFDMRPGRPDPSSFPRGEWLRALKQAFAVAADDALGYGSPQGQLDLRTQLASYLARARGLRVTAGDLLVTTGFTQSLVLMARALAASGVRRVAVEAPSMALHREILRAAGHELVAIGVDADGARTHELASLGVGAVLLTPNRQHPTGATLSAARRLQLLHWARSTGAIVIEDDYDGEFRYDGHPISPLQGLDPGVVAYGGTTSKTLAPGVRLGWLAVPAQLREAVLAEKRHADWHAGALDQLALAELLRTNRYDRHVRRMRLHYQRRRDAVLAAVDPGLRVLGGAAGLNLLIPLEDPRQEAAILDAARLEGLGLGGLIADGYCEPPDGAGVIVGYAAAPRHAFDRAVETLAAVLVRQ